MFKIKGNITITIFTVTFLVFTLYPTSGHNTTQKGLIYILLWTSGEWEPYDKIAMEQKAFESCTFNNCFLTRNRTYLKNILDYDVLMFNVWHVGIANLDVESTSNLPSNRSETQKYCMYAVEPPGYHPIYAPWNGFFNMTFTFKLTSNASIPYIVIMDKDDEVIGPKVDMHWLKLNEMNETSDYVKTKLQNKYIAAAWIVSNCETPWRNFYAKHLRSELGRLGHRLDVYGRCGSPCPRDRMEDCLALIESDYFFYLSFENSFGDDYVTEKILHALEHFAVPVVFGGANYTRYVYSALLEFQIDNHVTCKKSPKSSRGSEIV